jgi:hypothetical protein
VVAASAGGWGQRRCWGWQGCGLVAAAIASVASQVRRRHGVNGGGRRRRVQTDEGEKGGGDGKGGLVVAAIASAARQVRRRQVPRGAEGRAASPKCRATALSDATFTVSADLCLRAS